MREKKVVPVPESVEAMWKKASKKPYRGDISERMPNRCVYCGRRLACTITGVHIDVRMVCPFQIPATVKLSAGSAYETFADRPQDIRDILNSKVAEKY